jgi:flagellar motor switch protein FliG
VAKSNLHQAAVVLRSLPDPQAARLLEKLPPQEAAMVSDEIARIGRPSGPEQEAAIREFAAATSRPPRGNRAAAGDVSAPDSAAAPFEFLGCLDAEEILPLLADEHPQTIALVLFHLPSDAAAGLVGRLGLQKQTAVIRRIATMALPDSEIVRELADGIRRRMAGGASQPKRGGMAHLVKILHTMRPAAERQLLGRLAGTDPDLLSDIRSAMFGPDVALICPTPNA